MTSHPEPRLPDEPRTAAAEDDPVLIAAGDLVYAEETNPDDIPEYREALIAAALAARPEPELDVERLARAMTVTYNEERQSHDPDADDLREAALIATEYAALRSTKPGQEG
jgi:hypothetical protein